MATVMRVMCKRSASDDEVDLKRVRSTKTRELLAKLPQINLGFLMKNNRKGC